MRKEPRQKLLNHLVRVTAHPIARARLEQDVGERRQDARRGLETRETFGRRVRRVILFRAERRVARTGAVSRASPRVQPETETDGDGVAFRVISRSSLVARFIPSWRVVARLERKRRKRRSCWKRVEQPSAEARAADAGDARGAPRGIGAPVPDRRRRQTRHLGVAERRPDPGTDDVRERVFLLFLHGRFRNVERFGSRKVASRQRARARVEREVTEDRQSAPRVSRPRRFFFRGLFVLVGSGSLFVFVRVAIDGET